MEKHRKQTFLEGALVLTAAGLIVKLLGALYRIPLSRLIQGEGMGLYQMAYPIYVTLLSISTAGLPTAISKMVAERRALNNPRGAYRVFRVSLFILTAIGIMFSAMLLLGARFIAEKIIANPEAFYPLVSIAPAIFFVSIMSAYRGFFQGMQNMIPSAVSQVVEQVGRVAAVFVLVIILMPKGVKYAAAGAAFGPVVGAVMGLIILLIIFQRKKSFIMNEITNDRTRNQESIISIVYQLFAFAIPITLGGLIIPIMNLTDTAIVNRRLLVAGFNVEQATTLFGYLTGMAGPLVNLPPILTIALAASLVPAISESVARKNHRMVVSKVTTGIRLTIIFGLPSSVGLYLLATPICEMLYDNPDAGVPLSVLAFGVIFLTLNQTSAGILQGTGRTMIPVKNLLMGAIVKVILNFTLTGIPEINIRGAAIGTVGGYLVASMLNVMAVNRYIGINLNFKQMIIKPLIAVASMSIAVLFTYDKVLALLGSNTLATLSSISVGGIIYVLILLSIGGISEKDLELIPRWGTVIARVLSKIGIIRG